MYNVYYTTFIEKCTFDFRSADRRGEKSEYDLSAVIIYMYIRDRKRGVRELAHIYKGKLFRREVYNCRRYNVLLAVCFGYEIPKYV